MGITIARNITITMDIDNQRLSIIEHFMKF